MDARKIKIRRVDPAMESERIAAVLGRNLPEASSRERIEWLYLSNPAGPALVWLAEDEENRAVGTSAAHPRSMRIGGEIVTALNLSDFAIDPAFRSLGPGLGLLRATLQPVREGEYAFSYDYPSRAMHAIYRRMGGVDLGPTERWARPATLKGIASRKLGPTLGRLVGAAGDTFLRTRDALARRSRGVKIRLLEDAFSDEFDRLDAQLANLQPVQGVRGAAYLDWRFRRHTKFPHMTFCARRAGRLSGYLVLRGKVGSACSVVDLRAESENTALKLVAEAVEWTRDCSAEVLQVEVLAGGATAQLVGALGFLRREEGVGPVPFFAPGSPHARTLSEPANWWLIGGDRDI